MGCGCQQCRESHASAVVCGPLVRTVFIAPGEQAPACGSEKSPVLGRDGCIACGQPLSVHPPPVQRLEWSLRRSMAGPVLRPFWTVARIAGDLFQPGEGRWPEPAVSPALLADLWVLCMSLSGGFPPAPRQRAFRERRGLRAGGGPDPAASIRIRWADNSARNPAAPVELTDPGTPDDDPTRDRSAGYKFSIQYCGLGLPAGSWLWQQVVMEFSGHKRDPQGCRDGEVSSKTTIEEIFRVGEDGCTMTSGQGQANGQGYDLGGDTHAAQVQMGSSPHRCPLCDFKVHRVVTIAPATSVNNAPPALPRDKAREQVNYVEISKITDSSKSGDCFGAPDPDQSDPKVKAKHGPTLLEWTFDYTWSIPCDCPTLPPPTKSPPPTTSPPAPIPPPGPPPTTTPPTPGNQPPKKP